mmetsp:Transcript_4849/g.5158  ORF Transcript_4849/g.5158 Transcript_4849/m.5158 type:complete len:139 (+) Transcript_4849:256-672(+)
MILILSRCGHDPVVLSTMIPLTHIRNGCATLEERRPPITGSHLTFFVSFSNQVNKRDRTHYDTTQQIKRKIATHTTATPPPSPIIITLIQVWDDDHDQVELPTPIYSYPTTTINHLLLAHQNISIRPPSIIFVTFFKL